MYENQIQTKKVEKLDERLSKVKTQIKSAHDIVWAPLKDASTLDIATLFCKARTLPKNSKNQNIGENFRAESSELRV